MPISKLPEVILKSEEDIKKHKLKVSVMGHVGDGNFHVCVSLDTENINEMKNFEAFSHSLVKNALNVDGTCTGEVLFHLSNFNSYLKFYLLNSIFVYYFQSME